MKRIIRVFPRRTSLTPNDDLAFIGDPPLIRPDADEVHVSCTFTWDRIRAQELALSWAQYYPTVNCDGPAFNNHSDEFIPGRYVRRGVTFTSRGCNHQCPWCLVWRREGNLRESLIYAGNIIQDNNLLQCSRPHIDQVFDMLRSQHAVTFSGGIEASRMTQEIADRMRDLRVSQMFLACDTKEAITVLRRAVGMLRGFSRDKLRCYVLLRFNPQETISEATERLLAVWHAGCMPFAQNYQPPEQYIDYPREWKQLARTWSRPAAMKTLMKNKEG